MSDAVIISLIAAVLSLFSLIVNSVVKIRLDRLHKEVNGRMTELIDTTAKKNKAEGILKEKKEREH